MFELSFIAFGWLIGGFINGIAGFGAAMVAMPIIAPFIDLSLAVPSCVLLVLTLNCQVTWTFRRHISFRYLKGIMIGAIPGVLLSSWFLHSISEIWLKAAMGSFISVYALWGLITKKEIKEKEIHPLWGYLSGTLSSGLGMAFGFNGPPLAAYVAYCGCDPKSAKGILGTGFIITGCFIVIAKAIAGQITGPVLMVYLAATPAVILGSKLGIFFSGYISDKAFRKVLFTALALMGGRIVWSVLA